MSDTRPKPFTFVLMPFDVKFDDVYNLGIKPACNEAGSFCERVDEQIFEDSILQRIYNQISKADIIIADMTGRNPNVFYEVGYAHALGKTVILLTQNDNDIPFDLKHYPHIIYEQSITNLKDELECRVKWHLENPKKKTAPPIEVVQVYMAGTQIVKDAVVRLKAFNRKGFIRKDNVVFNIDLYNPTQKLLDLSGIEFGIVFPQDFIKSGGVGILLPDERILFNLGSVRPIHPQGWQILSFEFESTKEETKEIRGKQFDCELRIHSEIDLSITEFKFSIEPDAKDEDE
jgi:nucleoside 2-deoxyribosyltransferase